MAQVQALKTCREMWCRAVLQTSILGQAIVLDLEKNAARRLSFAKALAPTNSPLAELSIPTTSSKAKKFGRFFAPLPNVAFPICQRWRWKIWQRVATARDTVATARDTAEGWNSIIQKCQRWQLASLILALGT
eukprot:g32378.t1